MHAPKRAVLSLPIAAATAALLLVSCGTADETPVTGTPDASAPALAQASDGVRRHRPGGRWRARAGLLALGGYLAALAAISARDMTAAADYLLAALTADSGNGELLRRTHLALVSAGRIPEALPIARELVEGGSVDRFAPLTLAADALDREAFDEAADALRRLPLDGYNTILASLLEGWVAAGRGISTAPWPPWDPPTSTTVSTPCAPTTSR